MEKYLAIIFWETKDSQNRYARRQGGQNHCLVSEEVNFFFPNATKYLDINKNSYIKDETNEYTDTVKKTIYKYVNHPSILFTKNNIRGATTFLFKEASLEDAEKEILDLNPKKAGAFQGIPPKILKNSINVCSETVKIFLMIQ